jgi:hypothetical protein
MQHNVENDCDIEDIITLLYNISDALQLCEEEPMGDLESALSISEILSSVQLRAVNLLGRVSKRHMHSSNAENCDDQNQNNGLASNYN